jgi:hypothetical protein
MKKEYYDWPKIMATKNETELMEIYSDRYQISKEKKMAVEQELVTRGILNTKGAKKINKIESEFKYLAAKLFKEGMSFSEIEGKLQSEGLNEFNSKKVVAELQKWIKKGKRNQYVYLSIGTVLTFTALVLYATNKLILGFAPWVVIGSFFAAGLTALSPKKFKKIDIYEIINYENTNN